jgi:hypothetical protein
MTTITTYTREQAKASDAKLAELWMVRAMARQSLKSAKITVHYAAGDSKLYYGGRSEWKLDLVDAIAKATATAQGTTYAAEQAARALREMGKATERLEAADTAVQEQERQWYEHGQWRRYIAVPGGHIHHNDGCFTLRWDTDTRWLPELSGDTEADAVAAYGPALCSHCYPSAPSDWRERATVPVDTDGNPLPKAQADAIKAERRAEKNAKASAKAAAEVRDPDTGRVLYKTDRAATNAVAGALKNMRWYEFDHPDMPEWESTVSEAIAALAAKQGVDPDALRAEAEVRADKAYQAGLRKAWRELKADCACGRWGRSCVNMDSATVRYGRSIGEELVFARD